eukprot:c17550_g1_i2.p1 GENE.c17550_g1_i2~~c17550_g1_i2.p1  ORF type:complete len:446 (+),score=58.33 c17550_g1_i2:1158-2495(+)
MHRELRESCPGNCSGHGSCFAGKCSCDETFMGVNCTDANPNHKGVAPLGPSDTLCPFLPESPLCLSPACRDQLNSRTHVTESHCGSLMCDYCRTHTYGAPADPGCGAIHVAIFCAAEDRRVGCEHVDCLPREQERCGHSQRIKQTLAGCCFNPNLDCEDKCSSAVCTSTPECGPNLVVRYPFADCCFNEQTDCIDKCAAERCADVAPACPIGKKVRVPYDGCCFDPEIDCESACLSTICDETILPEEACAATGKRWAGSIAECCFDASIDCIDGDGPIQAAERAALMALYDATGGKSWKQNSGWGSDGWLCYWVGIECSKRDGEMHVTSVQLPNNGLEGRLPAELESLKYLSVLDLSHNSLNGRIPEQLRQLTKLQVLKLGSNDFNGPIPEGLGALEALVLLDVRSNQLTGSLPESTWSNRTISCSNNCMCEACLPRTACPTPCP